MDPFAPIPSAASSQEHAPCPRCGKPMDPALAAYDEAGRLVCRSCISMNVVAQANRTIEEKDPTSTRNLWLGAAGSVLVGLATCLLAGAGMFFLVAPLAIITGGWTIIHLLRQPDTKTQLGGGWWVVLLLSVAGVLFGLLAIAVGFLALAAEGMLAG